MIDGRSAICPVDLAAGRALFDYGAASLAWAARGEAPDPLAERIAAAYVFGDPVPLSLSR